MNSDHRQTLYAAGRITKAFGIRGEVKIQSYARSAQEFEALETIKAGTDEARAGDLIIEQARQRGDDIYLKFRGIDDRNAADALVQWYLYVDEARRKPPEPGRYYIHDLLGCRVETEAGTELGTLRDVMNVAAHAMYVVSTRHGDVLMPAVPEFIIHVDVGRKVMTVRPPEGLFEGEGL